MKGISYWIEKRAYISPERTALVGEKRRLTYREMAVEISKIANFISQNYHVKKGDRVAILSGNNIEYFLVVFALAKLGCIAVPLNIRLSKHELEYQLNDSQASVLITDQQFAEMGKQLIESTAIKYLTTFEDLMLNENDSIDDHEEVSGSTPLLIIYTSGTTGRPKGAVLTHENMYWNAVNNILSIDITSDDRILTILPLFHIGGLGLFALPTLFAGGTVVVPDRFDPEKSLNLIEEEKITVMMGVPTIFDAIRKSEKFSKTNFESLRWFYSGGAPCPHELIHFYLERGIPLGQGYGMTETSPTVFMLLKEDYKNKIGSIGKPAPFIDIRIVDSAGRDVEDEEVGELIFKGPNVFKEYWNLPEATEKSFKDGWFYSGDLGKRDKDGFIYIAGRVKDMIISGGENIYPLEVEQVLTGHPAVDEAAVIGVADAKWGEIPKAVISVKAGAVLSEAEIINFCLTRLAKYKVPKSIELVSELPKNATGKIDKAALKAKYSGAI